MLLHDPNSLPVAHSSSQQQHSFRLFGVFDGHWGSRASNFATRFLPHKFDAFLNADINKTLVAAKSEGQYTSTSILTNPWIRDRYIQDGNLSDVSDEKVLSSNHAIISLYRLMLVILSLIIDFQ